MRQQHLLAEKKSRFPVDFDASLDAELYHRAVDDDEVVLLQLQDKARHVRDQSRWLERKLSRRRQASDSRTITNKD